MNPIYSIQKPCTEDWGKMNAEQQGRHCQVCCKTVVDFSTKSNPEIVDFLKTNSDKKICGRFRSEQLVPPAGSRAIKKNSRYRVFFAALVFVFGGMLFNSCSSTRSKGHPKMMGEIAFIPDSSTSSFNGDTIPLSVPDTTKNTGQVKPNCKVPDANVEIPDYRMGDVAFDPQDTLK
ncbi:MAG: hypothetical protein M3R17_09445 [Bacteroidota bacterium]|nr:hypothetical protein [Bacteroidota bacterium]